MDGVTQANYALSYMANVGVPQQQPWPEQQQVKDAEQKSAGTQVQGVGSDIRPEDAGAKVISSVDGDTVTISAEGQAYVQQTAATADVPDVTSATARVAEDAGADVQPAGAAQAEPPAETSAEIAQAEPPVEAAQAEPPAETFFDLPQGGGIERADFEQPEVQQIQNAAVAEQEAERVDTQLQPEQQQTDVVIETPLDKLAEEDVEPSDFRQYFNSELRQMLYRGQITQQQYNEEIESRQTENTIEDRQENGLR